MFFRVVTPSSHTVPNRWKAGDAPMCPLCHGAPSGRSWAGAIEFEGHRFWYLKCGSCGSLYCDPMPDDELLEVIYGTGYPALVSPEHSVEDPKHPERVLSVLAALPPGTFIDFGCGAGHLLCEAAALGWKTWGVELTPAVAAATAHATGQPVVPVSDVGSRSDLPGADVVHLGDVLEHLTDPDREFSAALSMLRPGGLVLAQGPLENNWTVFGALIRVAGRTRPTRVRHQPPTHVVQATARGQRLFFFRHGLAEQRFDISEVWWPAPSELRSCWRRPRLLILHLCRRLSLSLRPLTPRTWGDRYFYIGRKL
jgi:SAM-dependent methyltransferase